MLTDIRALTDQFLIAFPNINTCLASLGVKYRFMLVRCTLSLSGKNINNDTLQYLSGEVHTDIRVLADFSVCITNINSCHHLDGLEQRGALA